MYNYADYTVFKWKLRMNELDRFEIAVGIYEQVKRPKNYF